MLCQLARLHYAPRHSPPKIYSDAKNASRKSFKIYLLNLLMRSNSFARTGRSFYNFISDLLTYYICVELTDQVRGQTHTVGGVGWVRCPGVLTSLLKTYQHINQHLAQHRCPDPL